MQISKTSTQDIKKRLGTTRGLFPINGNELHLEISGAGLPILLLHDGIADSRGFDHQAEHLSTQYTVIRYDRAGYGSSKPPSVPYSEVKDLKTIYDLLGLQSAILLGGSAGGRLALNFAITHPNHVTALILAGAAISGFNFTEHMWYRGWRQEYGETIAEFINFWVNDPWIVAEENQPARARLRQILETSPQNLMNFPAEKLEDIKALPRLAEIQAPTLIVVGEHDIADNHAHAGVLQVSIQKSERQIITHSGHLVYLEKPEQFNQCVDEFLLRHFPI